MKNGCHLVIILVVAVCFLAGPPVAAGDVIINEIHYQPGDKTIPEEFVELYNRGTEPVDLSGWFFSSGISYTFADGVTIAPGGFVVIAEDPQTLADTMGAETALGPFEGQLSNEGERIALRGADGQLQDEVTYQSSFPWPSASSGDGSSMELIHPELDNDLGGSWRASGFVGDVPNERTSLLGAEDPAWRYRKGTSEASDPPDAWRQPDFVEDDTWLTGQTSIGYADDDDNTVLDDMVDSYGSIYMRHTFTIEGDTLPTALKLGLFFDDGAIVWINGVEVERYRVADGEIPFDGRARSGEARWTEVFLANPASYLVPGENLLAVHALNVRPSSNDFSADATLFIPGIDDYDSVEDFVSPPSPGLQNTVLSDAAPPQLRQVRHSPAEPTSGEAVAVSARVTDPDGVSTVSLEYQVVDPGSYIRLTDPEYATRWTQVPMVDDGTGLDEVSGDDVYTARLAPDVQIHRRLVRYRITATDKTGKSIRAPYIDDLQPNFAYFVYDGIPGWQGAVRPGSTDVLTFDAEVMSSLPAYHLIAVEQDVINSQYISSFENVHFLGTMVYDGEVYDHMEFENRGEFSTYVSGKNKWRLHFKRGHLFQARDNYGRRYRERWKTMNFSAAATPWVPTNRGMAALGEAVAFKLYDLAGSLSPNTNFLQFRIIDEAEEADPTDQYRGDLWGLYMTIEHTDGPFLEERGLPDGNTYKIESSSGDKRNQGRTQPKGSVDFSALMAGYNRSQPVEWWRDNVDLAGYYTFRGINTAINNMDLREGWNICQYHNPETDRWTVIPWDLDMLYMPVTHWSGVMNFMNALRQRELATEYRNRARELGDLLFIPDQFGLLVDEYAAFENPPGRELTFVDVDEAMWNYHPRAAGGHRGAFYRNPPTHSARGGSLRRVLVTPDHEGMAQWIKDFVLEGYGREHLDQHARDTEIPEQPTITSVGAPGFPLDDLRFESSAFADPDGSDTFGAMKWRVAEISPAAAGLGDLTTPKRYEIVPTWESDDLTAFEPQVAIPAERLKVGAVHRARVRMMDATGRWSHWSAPVEFTPTAPASPFPQQGALRVTEILYNPADDEDLEFIELTNTGTELLDLRSVRFTDGIEFSFAGSDVEELAPGAFVVVAGNRSVFEAHHGAGISVAGEYSGRLDNAGERLELTYGVNTTILEFTYEDDWHPRTDGDGYSLVIADSGAPTSAWSEADGWRESAQPGGSPGRAEGDAPPGGFVLPGDVNASSDLEVSDAIRLLRLLFAGEGLSLPCEGQSITEGSNLAVADFDASGGVDTTDAVLLLGYLFRQGPGHALGARCVRMEGCATACR